MPALSKYSHVTSYSKADKALGDKNSLVIGNNTELVRDRSGSISVELHGHRVITFQQNSTIVLDSAGYQTTTTKDRLNRYTPNSVRVFQDDFEWYVRVDGEEYRFNDGMRV